MGQEGDLREMWCLFKETCDPALRHRLIETYLPLVRHTAWRLKGRLPGHIDIEDMISAGAIGLIHAVDKFDPDNGAQFETYCSIRIRGAILDDLRATDWVPRPLRDSAHKLQHAKSELAFTLGRDPTDDELAAFLGLSLDEYFTLLKKLELKSVVCVEGNQGKLNCFMDRSQADPIGRLILEEVRGIATRGLTPTEQKVLVLHYFESLSMREIGALLHKSESRVCGIDKKVLARLRDRFEFLDSECVAVVPRAAVDRRRHSRHRMRSRTPHECRPKSAIMGTQAGDKAGASVAGGGMSARSARAIKGYCRLGRRIAQLAPRQQELAEVLHITQQTTSKKLRGEAAIQVSDLEILARQFDLRMSWFFDGWAEGEWPSDRMAIVPQLEDKVFAADSNDPRRGRATRDYCRLGCRIAELVTRQQDLAEVLDISQQTISRKLRGDVAFLVSELETLARHFNLRMSWFFEGWVEGEYPSDRTAVIPELRASSSGACSDGLNQDRPRRTACVTA